jgi:hypothetical protein
VIEVIIKLDKPELRTTVSQAKSKVFSSESTVASSIFFFAKVRVKHMNGKVGIFYAFTGMQWRQGEWGGRGRV